LKDKELFKKSMIFILSVIGLVALIIGYGYINYKYGIGFPCMSNKIFGINCPGCGMTRAAVAMMQLNFIEAINYNAFSIILLPILFIGAISMIWESIFKKPTFVYKIPVAFWVILFSTFIIYGVVRNFIPGIKL